MNTPYSVDDMAALEALDTSALRVGDVYRVAFDGTDHGANYVWNGTAWDKLGGTVTTLKIDENYTCTNVIHTGQHYTNGRLTSVETKTTVLTPHLVRKYCPKCKAELVHFNVALTSYPTKYPHICPVCDRTITFYKSYPSVEFKDEETGKFIDLTTGEYVDEP